MMDRDDLLSLLGPMPVKTELDLHVIEEVDCATFIRKKLFIRLSRKKQLVRFFAFQKLPAHFCLPFIVFINMGITGFSAKVRWLGLLARLT